MYSSHRFYVELHHCFSVSSFYLIYFLNSSISTLLLNTLQYLHPKRHAISATSLVLLSFFTRSRLITGTTTGYVGAVIDVGAVFVLQQDTQSTQRRRMLHACAALETRREFIGVVAGNWDTCPLEGAPPRSGKAQEAV